jgi:hypothetical protein
MPVDDAQPILMELLGPGTRGRGGYIAASFGEECVCRAAFLALLIMLGVVRDAP